MDSSSSSSSSSSDNLSARERNDYDYTIIIIRIMNKLVEVLLNLLQVMSSSNSALNTANVIILLVFVPISFTYIALAEIITHVPNMRYRRVIGSVISVLGVLTCTLLLVIIFLLQA